MILQTDSLDSATSSATNAVADKINLLGMSRQVMGEFFATLGEKPFRVSQVMQWIHHYGVSDFNAMTNLSKALRQKLIQIAEVGLPHIVLDQTAADGTRKWVFRLDNANSVETVFIPESGRGTLCISSQVGCALNCSFCSTARQGFNRNLTSAEIIAQIWMANRALGRDPKGDRVVTNVVLMGMGEPLLNFDNVLQALEILQDDFAYGLSKRRVTLSTSGIVPALQRLQAVSDVALAVSLHAPSDELRDQLVPINQKYPIAQLIAACKNYIGEGRRKVTIEYVMIRDINDQDQHAKALAKVLRGLPAKINLIPFNQFPGSDYQCSLPERIKRFQQILIDAGYITTLRKTRGENIDAACGQLVGKVQDKSRRQQKILEATPSSSVLAPTSPSLTAPQKAQQNRQLKPVYLKTSLTGKPSTNNRPSKGTHSCD